MLRRKLKKAVSKDDKEESPQIKISKTNSAEAAWTTESKYFPGATDMTSPFINEQLIQIGKRLNSTLKEFTFPKPIRYTYNPVEYASKPHHTYINRFGTNTKDVLFVGMNPGPFGMCQTGVPFGEVAHVRDWLRINEEVGKPEIECPNRLIEGFACTRSEQSGFKFWGLFKSLCETPERFFRHTFVYNYCPLAFMDEKGKNITPNVIKGPVRKSLEEACDGALHEIINTLQPKYVIGIGAYARDRCLKIQQSTPFSSEVICLIHPSPIIPKNQNWPEKAENFLSEHNLLHYFKKK